MEELPRLRVVPSQMNSQPYWKSQSLKAILLGDPSFRSFCPRFHFTQVPHPKGLSHALTQYQGPLYTHFEKLPEAPTHALNLFLGGKMINTSGLSAPPSHLARCCNGKALLLAGYNHHMADTGPLGRRRSRVGCRGHSVSQQSPASLR